MTPFEPSSPLIVCGNPRSGTRMHANVLNAHPEVVITDEFHGLERMRAALSDFRKNALLKKFSRQQTLQRQAFLAKMFWLSYTVDRLGTRGFSARIIGNKTPQIERKFEILENVFFATPPRYVYCLRSAPKVLRSVKNLANLRWNRDPVDVNLERYIASVRCMEEMRRRFPDRVCVSVMDHLRPGMPNSAFFAPVFAFAGVELTPEVRSAIDAMGAQNTMEAVKSSTGQAEGAPVELTEKEVLLIERNEQYRRIRAEYALAS